MNSHNKTSKAKVTCTMLITILYGFTITSCSRINPVKDSQVPLSLPSQALKTATELPTKGTESPVGEATIHSRASFDGEKALEDVKYQVSLGPRIPDSPAHQQTVSWIKNELDKAGWSAEIQETAQMGHAVHNVVGKRGEGQPWIVLGAHFDSRMIADHDKDPEKAKLPVPGANDGASGVAVLLELARVLPSNLNKQVWLVFFDVEDNGDIPGWDWILGSRAFVQSLNEHPNAAIVIDMIGDANLDIYKEQNSDMALTDAIWGQAEKLGYNQFKPSAKFSILDDHTPFLQAGIPAIDIIDFDYPYYHTSEDTPDKVSAESLKAVGDTLFSWLTSPNS